MFLWLHTFLVQQDLLLPAYDINPIQEVYIANKQTYFAYLTFINAFIMNYDYL